MPTPSDSPLVYLEDLEQPSSQATAAASDDEKLPIVAASSDNDKNAKPVPTPSTTSASNGKRQRTLFDMFGSGSAPSQGSDAPSKKPKLAAASGSRNKPSQATPGTTQTFSGASGSAGQQPLNSIPFSLSEYVDSLTEDQKRLLKLECETMGKSW